MRSFCLQDECSNVYVESRIRECEAVKVDEKGDKKKILVTIVAFADLASILDRCDPNRFSSRTAAQAHQPHFSARPTERDRRMKYRWKMDTRELREL